VRRGTSRECCLHSRVAAGLRLGLDHEELGEIVAVTEPFDGMNRIGDGYRIEPDVKPAIW